MPCYFNVSIRTTPFPLDLISWCRSSTADIAPQPSTAVNRPAKRPRLEPTRSEGSCCCWLYILTFVADLIEEKRWSIFGAINRLAHYHIDPAAQAENKICLDGIRKEEFCLLTGSRASGKTTRLFRIRTQLDEIGDWCL